MNFKVKQVIIGFDALVKFQVVLVPEDEKEHDRKPVAQFSHYEDAKKEARSLAKQHKCTLKSIADGHKKFMEDYSPVDEDAMMA